MNHMDKKKEIDFRKTQLTEVVGPLSQWKMYRPDLGRFFVLGRSNVGKSSLLNALCGQKKLARVSSTPGKTQLVLHFLVDESLLMIDLPGYGYTATGSKKRENFSKLVDKFLPATIEEARNGHLLFLLLIDGRHLPSALDLQMYHYLLAHELPFLVVLTKADKLNTAEKNRMVPKILQALGEEGAPEEGIPYLLTSSLTRLGMADLRSYIASFFGFVACK